MIPQNATLTPPPEPAGEPPKHEGLLVVLAVVLGAAVVLGGLIGGQWFLNSSDDVALDTEGASADGETTENTTGPTTTVDSSSSTTATPDQSGEGAAAEDLDPPGAVTTVPCPERYTEEICAAAEFVQQTRGRPFKEFPVIELMDDATFDQALVDDLDESKPELIELEQLLKSLGLIELDVDLFATFQSLIESGVVGFYDPDTGQLVVRGGDFDLYGQSILVHELVHAFDDQWFDLGRDDFANDDAEYGYLAVIEGNATRVENLWRAGLSQQERTRLDQQEFSSLSPEDMQRLLSLPQILLNLQLSPYRDGEVYVSNLANRGGEAAVDERFENPPESSESVLHPNDSADGLTIVELEPPPVDGDVVLDDRLGELVTRFWLGERAADGWGGDRYIIWESGSETCTTVDYAADSDTDQLEIQNAAEAWQQELSDLREVEVVDGVDGSLVRITGCYR